MEIEEWISIEDEKAKQSDELDIVNTTRDDVAILSYTSGTTGNPKLLHILMVEGYAAYEMAPEHWLAIKEDDLVWATAAPGWQNGYGVHFSIYGIRSDSICVYNKFNPSVIYHYYKTLK